VGHARARREEVRVLPSVGLLLLEVSTMSREPPPLDMCSKSKYLCKTKDVWDTAKSRIRIVKGMTK
jgi:hypothetical protein